MSAGTYTPAKCPMCTGPLAYGSAAVTVVLLKFFCSMLMIDCNLSAKVGKNEKMNK